MIHPVVTWQIPSWPPFNPVPRGTWHTASNRVFSHRTTGEATAVFAAWSSLGNSPRSEKRGAQLKERVWGDATSNEAPCSEDGLDILLAKEATCTVSVCRRFLGGDVARILYEAWRIHSCARARTGPNPLSPPPRIHIFSTVVGWMLLGQSISYLGIIFTKACLTSHRPVIHFIRLKLGTWSDIR